MSMQNDSSSSSTSESDEESSAMNVDVNSAPTTTRKALMQEQEQELKDIKSKSADVIRKLAKKTTNLIEKYMDTSNDEIIEDPMRVYAEMGNVSKDMTEAWNDYHAQIASHTESTKVNEEEFGTRYMSEMTGAFADELDDLRQGRVREEKKKKTKKQEEEDKRKKEQDDILMQDNIVMPNEVGGHDNVDVEVLIYMLKSGMDQWSEEEKTLLLLDEDDELEEDELTPHELRRREMFGEL
uniref:Uncharacterized protein n=1 Tax=Chaetoceros debilis TaxID=122233 RepID=A0A7S3PZA7_9STRA|mmetsp:Transcript_21739/g.32030  ORF Transcript_21739/g.32030 Transcript_21739/m.32030 type:complete len:239 (+) Transcript_21739:116-832(+)